MRFCRGMLFSLFLGIGFGQAQALDEELKLGRAIFQQYCAACHGVMAEGDGPLANLFKVKPRALSLLSRENDGEYPFELVLSDVKGNQAGSCSRCAGNAGLGQLLHGGAGAQRSINRQ